MYASTVSLGTWKKGLPICENGLLPTVNMTMLNNKAEQIIDANIFGIGLLRNSFRRCVWSEGTQPARCRAASGSASYTAFTSSGLFSSLVRETTLRIIFRYCGFVGHKTRLVYRRSQVLCRFLFQLPV